MREHDIRSALHFDIRKLPCHDEETLVIDELGLCEGDARIDIAVVNGTLTGYEIKSAADTLQRLPNQVAIYSRLFDQVTLVSSKSHIEKADHIIPPWWGITEVSEIEKTVKFSLIREAQDNPSIDAFYLAQLLWRDEALLILKEIGAEKGVMSKPRDVIWRRLSEATTVTELSRFVRQRLKARQNWRVDRRPVSNGD